MKHKNAKKVFVILVIVMLFSILTTAAFADAGNEDAPAAKVIAGETTGSDGAEYASLQDAFAAAEDGATITLLKDLALTFADGEFIDIAGKSVTLDFNGFGISVNDHLFLIEEDACLTMVNAKLTATEDAVIDYNYGTVIIGGTNTAQITASDCFIEENYGVAKISNAVFSDSYDVIYYNYGTATMENVAATLDDSVMSYNYGTAVFTDMTVDACYAFPVEDQYTDYVSDYGIPSTVVNGGTFIGEYFNCCMYGSAEINGATITAEYDMDLCYDSSYDVKTVVTVNDCVFNVTDSYVFDSFGDDIVLIVKGGTYTAGDGSIIYGVYGNARVELQSGSYTATDDVIGYLDDNATVIISGGTYVTEDTIVDNSGPNTTLEIHGGTFTSYNYAIDEISGKLVITDGTITSETCNAVYLYQSDAEISGGAFTSLGDGYSALYVDSNDAKVLLSGGVFTAGGDVCAFGGNVTGNGLTIADDYRANPADWLAAEAKVIEIGPSVTVISYYSEGELYSQSAELCRKQVFPAEPVSSAGYDFLYWETADHKYVDDPTNIMEDMSLYAVFSDRTYTVTLVDNEQRTDVVVPAATSIVDVPGFVRGNDDGFMFWENGGNEVDAAEKVYSDTEITAYYGELVTNYEELENAIKNRVPKILLGADIEVEDTLVIDYDCFIYGKGSGLIRPDDFLGVLLMVGSNEESGVEANIGSLSLKNTLIDGRNVEANAPAIVADMNFSALYIDNCTITNCCSVPDKSGSGIIYYGAAIAIDPLRNSGNDIEVIISNSKICGNHTANYGAAVYVSGNLEGRLEISGTEICHNTADAAGGGIFFNRSNQGTSDRVISDVDLHDNYARDGGAIMAEACSIRTNNVNIYDNKAMYGGGVSVEPLSMVFPRYQPLIDLTGANFYRNFASGADGNDSGLGTDSCGDDFCYHFNRNSAYSAYVKLPESMNGQPYASLKTDEERTVCDVEPFTDEDGNAEPVPDNLTIPFFAWYIDGKYQTSSSNPRYVKPRFTNQEESEKICKENDNLPIIDLTLVILKPSSLAPDYGINNHTRHGLKAEYNGLLLKYVANNGTDEQMYDSKAYLKDSNVIVRDNDTDIGFTYEHHKFIGWNTEKDGSGTFVNDNFIITENTILYAQWELEQYVVTYVVNGDPTYGTPTDGTTPKDEDPYFYMDQVTVKEYLNTTWTTDNGKEDGIPGTWEFIPWDKDDFQITEDTEIHGSWQFTPDPVGSLTIKKTVTGDDGDKTKYFTFTVVFNAEGSYNYTGSKSGVVKSGDTVLLKHGESITIEGLPAGTDYSVTESESTEYLVYASGDTGTIIANETVAAEFTNEMIEVPVTGDTSNFNLWLGVACVSCLGILSTALLEGKRRKNAIR